MTGSPTNAVLVTKLDALQEDMCALDEKVTEFIDESREFRLAYTREHENLRLRVDQVEKAQEKTDKKIAVLETDMHTISKGMVSIQNGFKLIQWIGGTIGGVTLAWLLGKLLGLL